MYHAEPSCSGDHRHIWKFPKWTCISDWVLCRHNSSKATSMASRTPSATPIVTKPKNTKFWRNSEFRQHDDGFYWAFDDYRSVGGPYRCQIRICNGFSKKGIKCQVYSNLTLGYCSRHGNQWSVLSPVNADDYVDYGRLTCDWDTHSDITIVGYFNAMTIWIMTMTNAQRKLGVRRKLAIRNILHLSRCGDNYIAVFITNM